MQLLREYLFLVILGATVVVLGGTMVFLGMSQKSAFEGDLKPRKDLDKQLKDLAQFRVSEDSVEALKKYVENVKGARDEILGNTKDWNRRNYKVMELSSKDGKVIPAFPHDPKVYRRNALTYAFTKTYGDLLRKALDEISPTSVPTEEEIKNLTADWARRIAVSKEIAELKVRNAFAMLPEGTDQTVKPASVSDAEWQLKNMTTSMVEKQADARALKDLTVGYARRGALYASYDALDVVFPEAVVREDKAPAEDLWAAQVNLWVTKDILAVLDATIKQSLQVGDETRKATVPNSAIKELVKVSIDEKYVVGTSSGGDRGFAGGKQQERTVDTKRDSLTGRVSSREYEIVEYSFTVVMNTKFLPALLKNLMVRGDHQVLNVKMEPVVLSADDPRYYGVDPVSKVTITGELLTWASWTRGTVEKPAEQPKRGARLPRPKTLSEMKWESPPLMPVEVLRSQLSDVLRDEDRLREELSKKES